MVRWLPLKSLTGSKQLKEFWQLLAEIPRIHRWILRPLTLSWGVEQETRRVTIEVRQFVWGRGPCAFLVDVSQFQAIFGMVFTLQWVCQRQHPQDPQWLWIGSANFCHPTISFPQVVLEHVNASLISPCGVMQHPNHFVLPLALAAACSEATLRAPSLQATFGRVL